MNNSNTESLEGQLIDQHYGLVVSQAIRLSSQKSDLEDCIQVGLIGLLKAIRNYDPDQSKFSTFATVCIKNEIFRHIRKNKKKTIELPHSVETKSVLRSDNSYSPKDSFWEIVPECLTDKERLVLKMKVENYTHREIAHRLSCPKNQVKHIIRKVINTIRRYNKHEEEEDTSL